MIKLSRARVNESLYWPLWVSWSDKIRCKVLGNKNTPEFQVFHGYLIDIDRQRKESSEKVWKRVEGPSSLSSRSDNECYYSPPRWGFRPWQAWLQVRSKFRRYLFILLVMEKHTESTVSYLRTQHSDPDRFRTQTSRLKISALTVQPSLLQGRMGWVRLLPYVLRKLVKVTSHGLCRGLQFRVVIKKRRAHCCVTCQGIKGLKVIKSN